MRAQTCGEDEAPERTSGVSDALLHGSSPKSPPAWMGGTRLAHGAEQAIFECVDSLVNAEVDD